MIPPMNLFKLAGFGTYADRDECVTPYSLWPIECHTKLNQTPKHIIENPVVRQTATKPMKCVKMYIYSKMTGKKNARDVNGNDWRFIVNDDLDIVNASK